MEAEATKSCPQCATRCARDALRCHCGFAFTALPADAATPGLVAQAEKLYEYYLSTRLSRALKEVKTAQIELLRDPTSAARAADLRRAEEEVRLLQAQLALQAARTAQAHQDAGDSAAAMRDASSAVATQAPAVFSEQQAARADAAYDGARRDTQPAGGVAAPAAFASAQQRLAERVLRDQSPAGPRPFISDDELAALRRPSAPAKR
jgi:hypothetical protein